VKPPSEWPARPGAGALGGPRPHDPACRTLAEALAAVRAFPHSVPFGRRRLIPNPNQCKGANMDHTLQARRGRAARSGGQGTAPRGRRAHRS